jgi:NADH-quinone oxidoreductase subunit H
MPEFIRDALLPLDTQLFVGVVVLVLIIHIVLAHVGLLTFFERKISAYMQDRVGPNRVGFDLGLPVLKKLFRGFGFWGLGQALADGLKFILKEDYRPKGTDAVLFTLAPMLAVIPALIGWAVIPWGGTVDLPEGVSVFGEQLVAPGTAVVSAANVNIGFIYLLAVASMGVYGVVLGGWASNNKYSFLGGLRSSAGMISYELPMGLCILAVVLTAGTVLPSDIVESQAAGGWFIVAHPLIGLIFFVCTLAEANRAPFDNAECEQELVGGFHTEYSSMRFALFFLAEYAHVITGAAFFVLLFLGGYHLPGVGLTGPEATGIGAALTKFAVFFTKVIGVVVFIMVVRWTIPRLRWDQVMKVCWNALIPITLTAVVAISVSMFLGFDGVLAMLVVNLGVLGLAVLAVPMLPRDEVNKRIPLAGSRYSPLPGERVLTGARPGLATADSPFGSPKETGQISVQG